MEILPAFLEAINLIIDETTRVMPHSVQIGYIVLPPELFFYWSLLDDVMHEMFDYYPDSRRGCYNEYDVIGHITSAQFAYELITPDDLGVPWVPDGREIWEEFGQPRHDDILAEPDSYIFMANLKRDYLEIAPFSMTFGGEMPMKQKHLPDLGEDFFSCWEQVIKTALR